MRVFGSLLLLAACAPDDAPRATGDAGWWAVVGPRLFNANLSFTEDDGVFHASTPAGLRSAVDATGASLWLGQDHFRLSLLSWGREDAPLAATPVAPVLGDCTPELLPDGSCLRRVEQAADGLSPWFLNRSVGLEQGWDLADPPAGEGLLSLALAVQGGALEVEEDGQTAWITGDQGELLRYSDLAAWDASGAPLDAWMEADGQRLWIRVDDAGARYPVTIDPLATSASTSLSGSSSSEFGFTVDGAGDVNNDGYDDVIVGAEAYSSAKGAAYVFHGARTGLGTTARTSITGSTSAYLGYSVSAAGDVNGDGYDDVIIGAPGISSLKGAAYVHHGSSSGVSSTAASTLSGTATSGQFGFAVSGAGDVNNDGYDDVIVGANAVSSGTGAAYVFHGRSSGVNTTATTTLSGSSSYYFGESVAGAGDVTGDGYDDVLVGAPGASSSRGLANLYKGSSGGVSTSAVASLSGPATSAAFGEGVAGAGDVNADGYDDIIVGAYGYSSGTGAAYVYHGKSGGVNSTASTSLTGSSTYSRFGFAVDGLGDVDGDGYDDVIVGAYLSTSGTGVAYAYAGSASGVSTTVSATLSGTASGGYFGYDVAGAGDVNGDGYNDAIVGAPLAGSAGAAYIFNGEPNDEDGDGYDAADDCDDTDARVHPGATELVGDGVDQDCDGKETCYQDSDNDDYRTSSTVSSSDEDCNDKGEALSTTASGDCDDSDATVNPGATEITGDEVDQDCDNKETCYRDADADGYRTSTTVSSSDEDCDDAGEAASSVSSGDCDDGDADINPGESEGVGDGVDQDCDGKEECFNDLDNDGYRSASTSASSDEDCLDSGEALSSDPSGDCDDRDASVHPGATEIPKDGTDQDCDGSDGYDADGDGHDDVSQGGDDCDDNDADAYPDATEVPYDGVDQDCDGSDLDDVDGDGSAALEAGGDDCDDHDDTVYPGAEERDDGLDNDCDGYDEDADPDQDGLTDAEEAEYGTDPRQADTDGDGVNDGDEVEAGTDPLRDEGGSSGTGDDSGDDGGTGGGASSGGGGCGLGLDSYALLLLTGLGLRRRRATR